MITVQAYRVCIGSYLHKARSIQKESIFYQKLSLNFMDVCSPQVRNSIQNSQYFLRTFGVLILIVVLFCNLNLSFLKMLKLLNDGDVESNPGPAMYKILKSVSGSFHHAHMKFLDSAGFQCSCNALYAICFSLIKKFQFGNPGTWIIYWNMVMCYLKGLVYYVLFI